MNGSKQSILSSLNEMSKKTLIEILSIEFIHMNSKTLTAKMPVNFLVYQPNGFLHGGASVVLAESVGCALSTLHVDKNNYDVLGIKICANHVTSIKEGFLYAKASFLKKGHFIHLVEIKLYDNSEVLISFVLLTNFIKKKSFG